MGFTITYREVNKYRMQKDRLSDLNIPARALHVLLERIIKEWIEFRKRGLLGERARHQGFLIAYHKAFQMKNRLKAISPTGKALCLLKTQFAKKPKNPV
jgi:hypothetical protein